MTKFDCFSSEGLVTRLLELAAAAFDYCEDPLRCFLCLRWFHVVEIYAKFGGDFNDLELLCGV